MRQMKSRDSHTKTQHSKIIYFIVAYFDSTLSMQEYMITYAKFYRVALYLLRNFTFGVVSGCCGDTIALGLFSSIRFNGPIGIHSPTTNDIPFMNDKLRSNARVLFELGKLSSTQKVIP